MLCLLHTSSTKVRQSVGTKVTYRRISTHHNGNSEIKISSNSSTKLLLNDLVAKNLVIKRTRKANKKYQSDHEKLYMRNWTYAASWLKKGQNPFEALESKAPDPPRVGEQGPEDFLVTTGEIGCTRNISIHMPQSYNPLNKNVVQRIDALLRKYETGNMINTVNFSGYDGNFSTGLDFGYIFSHRDTPEGTQYLKQAYQMAYTLATMKTPVVSFLDGICLGAGNSLFLHAPIRFATDRGLLAIRDIEVGWFPDAGVSHALAQMPNGLGMYLALSGHAVEGADLYWSGLANYWCISSAVSQVKSGIGGCYSASPERVVMAVEASKDNPNRNNNFFSEYEANIARCFSKDTLEGIMDALQQDGGGWALKTLQKIRSANPISVLVTFRLIKLAQKMTLEQTIKMEYNIAQQFLKTRDLYEGIERLVLKDPPEEPQWQYKSIEEVPQQELDKYFTEKGKDNIELVRMSDSPPHELIEKLVKIHREFEVDKMTKEERSWRSKMSSELLEVILPYLEKCKQEIEKDKKLDLVPTVQKVSDEIDLYTTAIIQKRIQYDPCNEITEYIISKTTPVDKLAKYMATFRNYVTKTVPRAEYLQELFRELQNSKDPSEKKRMSEMHTRIGEITTNLTKMMFELKERKESLHTMVKPVEELQNLLNEVGQESLNPKEQEIVYLLRLEYLVNLSEEELYQRFHDKVLIPTFSAAEASTLLKLFKSTIDTAWEENGYEDLDKELKDFVKVWKLQIDQILTDVRHVTSFKRQTIAELPADEQQAATTSFENDQYVRESFKRLESDLNMYLLEQYKKIPQKMYNATPANFGDYTRSQKEYLQEIQKATPKIIDEFYQKNSHKLLDIYKQAKERLVQSEAAISKEKTAAIKTQIPSLQVKERTNELIQAIAGYKGNLNLSDHVHALQHLRHSVNQELNFLRSPEKSNLFGGLNEKESKDLETNLLSLIESIDNLLLKCLRTKEKIEEELKKSALPIYNRIVHKYFEPNTVQNPEVLNSMLAQKYNPVGDVQKLIQRLSTGENTETSLLSFLKFQEEELKRLYRSLGANWLIYRQKMAFGLPPFTFCEPERMARVVSDFNNGKIDINTFIENSGITEHVEHYRNHGFSDLECQKIKETFTKIYKLRMLSQDYKVPSKEITTKFLQKQLEVDRLTLSQRKQTQTNLKKLLDGSEVERAVPYLSLQEKDDEVIENDPEWEVKVITEQLKHADEYDETFLDQIRDNTYQILKGRGIDFQRTPISNEQVLDYAQKMDVFYGEGAEAEFRRKEALLKLNTSLRQVAKTDVSNNLKRNKNELDDAMEALNVILGKIGKYYDSTSPNPAERLESQIYAYTSVEYENALDPKVKESVESLRSKMQKIKNDLERSEIEAAKTLSYAKLSSREFDEILKDIEENSILQSPSELRHPKDPAVAIGEDMQGMSFEEIADFEQEFEWALKDEMKSSLKEEDKV